LLALRHMKLFDPLLLLLSQLIIFFGRHVTLFTLQLQVAFVSMRIQLISP
jgi:hypothetical protein